MDTAAVLAESFNLHVVRTIHVQRFRAFQHRKVLLQELLNLRLRFHDSLGAEEAAEWRAEWEELEVLRKQGWREEE